MRTRNALINSSVGLFCNIIVYIGPLFFVTPLIGRLGAEYLGVQKTFTDIVGLLSIVELGITVGIIYKLYKPMADRDFQRVAVIANFYKKIFKIIAVSVAGLGLVTSFFMVGIVHNRGQENFFSPHWIQWTFLLFVCETLATYLFTHKRAILIADQKNYVVMMCRMVCQLCMFAAQVILLSKGSFEGYVVARVVFATAEGCFVNFRCKKLYPELNLKTRDKLPERERSDLFKNLNALFFHKIGEQGLTAGSTVIMTSFLGQVITGIYAPYTIISNGVNRLISQVFSSITSSFGNLLAQENRQKIFEIYNNIFLLNYFIFSFAATSIMCMARPFVALWMGPNFILPPHTVFLLALSFFLVGMRNPINMVRTSAGLFRPDKYFPLVEAALNILLCLVLVRPLGIDGIFIGNILSMLFIPIWTQPYIVYKNIFYRPVTTHHLKFSLYFVLTLALGSASWWVCGLFHISGVAKLFVNALVCLSLPNTINWLIFHKSREYKYLQEVATRTFSSLLRKFFKARG